MARDFPKTSTVAMRCGINTYSPVFSGATKLAIACWANADTFNTALGDNRIFTTLINNSLAAILFYVNGSTSPKVLRATLRSIESDASQGANATTEFTTGVWHHVGAVFNIGADTVQVYMNGVEEAN